jgi:hypothetical protein
LGGVKGVFLPGHGVLDGVKEFMNAGDPHRKLRMA